MNCFITYCLEQPECWNKKSDDLFSRKKTPDARKDSIANYKGSNESISLHTKTKYKG